MLSESSFISFLFNSKHTFNEGSGIIQEKDNNWALQLQISQSQCTRYLGEKNAFFFFFLV